MKTQLFSLLLFSMAVSLSASEPTDNQLTMSLQLRPRAEYRNGVLSPRQSTDEAAAFINNRTRLTIDYRTKGLSMGLSAQNASVWGQETQVSKNPNLSIYEAWAQLHSDNGFFLKIGRQSLVYDDERILGALDWNPAGRSHDVLKTGFENKKHKLHLALAFNQNSENVIGGTYYYPNAQPYKTMQLLWYQYLGTEYIRPSFMIMNLGIETGNAFTRKSELASMQTIGTHIITKPSKSVGVDISAYYQMGKNRSGQSISAWMAAYKGTYILNGKLSLIAGTDVLSGEETINKNTTFNAFNPLYGTHHKFYGAMDYFYASDFRGNLNPGLWDSYAGVSIKKNKNLTLSAFYHYFAITADIADSMSPLKKTLGSEIDLQLDWNIRSDVRLSCGYSTMLGSSSMDVVKGGNHKAWQDWGWVAISFNPNILKAKF